MCDMMVLIMALGGIIRVHLREWLARDRNLLSPASLLNRGTVCSYVRCMVHIPMQSDPMMFFSR